MPASAPGHTYAFGHTDAEHDRLIRQAARLAPLTERFFREAGIGPGQRILDLGSGVGDVAMLTARIVGPSGEVVGVERDMPSIVRAQQRVTEAGLRNVTFVQADVGQAHIDKPFHAVVGRFILQFLPDPAGVLRSLSQLVIPGGVLAFQEVCWPPTIVLAVHLPLWSASLGLAHDTLKRSGANTEMGLDLYRIFQQAGFPAPKMGMEMLLGSEPDFTRWLADLLASIRPQIQQSDLRVEEVGDFETLAERLHAEVAASGRVAPGIAVIGARSRLAKEPAH
jgi:ubiquinone/menaquinone biosynthesis C-methylase UbiE